MKVPLGVRKGAWTQEEDILLRKCINDYGVGNWHLVPIRAGLNRCRKSCRLRWVNHLHPDIKRGHFTLDEVDLIIRLHKLLGNRWSLIAGRLPGRTANDVKNYWNTHLHKKMNIHHQLEDMKVSKAQEKETMKTKAIKPQPRSLSRINNLSCLLKGSQTTSVDDKGIVSKKDNSSKPSSQTSTSLQPENGISWWKSDDINIWEEHIANIWDEYNIAPATKASDIFLEQGHSGWNEFSLNVDLWDTLNVEHELM